MSRLARKRKENKASEKILLAGLGLFMIALIGISVSSFLNLQSALAGHSSTPSNSAGQLNSNMPSSMSRMALTDFDKQLARQMMDQDGDGLCDACGMPIEMCMDSGQMQCNMDPDAKIGVLGSAHIHANLSVVIDGKSFDVASWPGMASSFLHTDGQPKLHMHATGVPLWIFFESVGMKLESDKVTLFVNGEPNAEKLNYVFRDGDTIEVRYANQI